MVLSNRRIHPIHQIEKRKKPEVIYLSVDVFPLRASRNIGAKNNPYKGPLWIGELCKIFSRGCVFSVNTKIDGYY